MPAILDELRQEHRGIAEILGCLERQVHRVEFDERPDYEVIGAALDFFSAFPDRYHHPKEDLIYQRLAQRDQVSAWIVGDLAQAHEELARHLGTFVAAVRAVLGEAELPRDKLVGWARDFIDLQRRHLAMEEASFFPAAERALTAEDWAEVAEAARRRDLLLDADGQRQDHEALRRSVLAWDAQDREAKAADAAVRPAAGRV